MPNKTPFVSAAFVCERVLQEQDGVLTAVRIVDTFTMSSPEDGPQMVPIGVELTLLVMLKSGDVQGSSHVELRLRFPSGKIQELGKHAITLKGGEHGANIIAKLRVPIKEYGLHWFEVYWDSHALTSVPLRLLRAGTSS